MQPGTRLEHYEILDKIGEGGMGAVYRATDTRLKREVAVKVLPPEVASDPERLARLQREAQLLASLSHPNVASVYGFGDVDVIEDGVSRHIAYIAMELIDGESLYSRVATGPLPWREAVQTAVGIAAGLEAAHERGIVHRDLKPANVHLAADGTVKVLDFGLAKAFDADGSSSSLELSASPTVAAATRTGMILGTAAYMSPEQARGKAVDKRADIWALGCVLYEMLAGRKAFEGETVSDVLAAVLRAHPDLEALPPVPERLRALLQRLLQKDPKDRMRDVGDVRLELQAALNERARAVGTPDRGIAWPLLGAAVAVAAVVGLAAGWWLWSSPPPPEARVALAPDSIAGGFDALAISPDGTLVAESRPNYGIRLRSLGDTAWRQLPDTDGAFALQFDAAGRRLYFSRGNEVLSAGIDGTSPMVVATVEGDNAWVAQLYRGVGGDMQVAYRTAAGAGIGRIPTGGGLEQLWAGESSQGGTDPLATAELAPGRWLAWSIGTGQSAGVFVVEAGNPAPAPLLSGYFRPFHLGDGEVVVVDTRGRLAWMRVDPATGEVTAPPVVRVEGLTLLGSLAPAYDVSATGTLAYVAGTVDEEGEQLVWHALDHSETPASSRKGTYDIDSRVSPDGAWLALEVQGNESTLDTVQIHDLERDVRTTLTPGIRAVFPVWSPDSRSVAVLMDEGTDPPGIYVVPIDRSAPPRLIVPHPEDRFAVPMDWSPDGKWLLFVRSPNRSRQPAPGNDIWRVPAEGGDPEAVLATDGSEVDPRLSPDGVWMAYASDQSGQYEIYLRPAAGGGEVRVSADGGTDPEWDPAGGQLFFLRGREIRGVELRDDAARPVGAERVLTSLSLANRNRLYLPAAGGQRFLASSYGGNREANSVAAILNWRREPEQ